MINLLKEQNIKSIKKQHLIDMEEKVIKTLDYSLRSVSSLHFLERYERLFGLDQNKKDKSVD